MDLSCFDPLSSSILAMTTSDGPFHELIHEVGAAADRLGIPVAVVGGLAGIHHGSGVTTLDADLVVRPDDGDRLAAELDQDDRCEWKRRSDSGWHRLIFTAAGGVGLDVKLLPAGRTIDPDRAGTLPIPDPRELGVESGLGYADLAGWVVMKLAAGRAKDHYHLHEVLKRIDQGSLGQVVTRLRTVAPEHLPTLDRLFREAEDDRMP